MYATYAEKGFFWPPEIVRDFESHPTKAKKSYTKK